MLAIAAVAVEHYYRLGIAYVSHGSADTAALKTAHGSAFTRRKARVILSAVSAANEVEGPSARMALHEIVLPETKPETEWVD